MQPTTQRESQAPPGKGDEALPRKGLPERMKLPGTWLLGVLCVSFSAGSPEAAAPMGTRGKFLIRGVCNVITPCPWLEHQISHV